MVLVDVEKEKELRKAHQKINQGLFLMNKVAGYILRTLKDTVTTLNNAKTLNTMLFYGLLNL